MSDRTIETIEYMGYTIRIEPDDDGPNPRKDWDNLGTMTCFHTQYYLGDTMRLKEYGSNKLGHREWPVNSDGNAMNSAEEFMEWFKPLCKTGQFVVVLPLILYDHSGLCMSSRRDSYPFNCQWDSSHVGYIYVTREKALKEYGVKRITKQIREKVTKVLEGEVETYSSYLEGDVVGYVVEDEAGNHIDSCWGYVGDQDYAISKAKSAAEYAAKQLNYVI